MNLPEAGSAQHASGNGFDALWLKVGSVISNHRVSRKILHLKKMLGSGRAYLLSYSVIFRLILSTLFLQQQALVMFVPSQNACPPSQNQSRIHRNILTTCNL